MHELMFLGDVHWENKGKFPDIEIPYVFNFEYVIETKNGIPAKNKIIVTGSGNFSKWKKKPLAVNLANNHILDLGDEGFFHTLSVLEKNGIAYFGAGNEENNYNNPCVIELEGKKIAFLGYSDYEFLLGVESTQNKCAIPTEEQIRKDMELCKDSNADIVIVNMHWGREERSYHTQRQRMLGHKLIDAGADLVIGHHPHCIQPIEVYKEKSIFYSLGNSYFPNINSPSYYDETGNSAFTASVRNLECGRESLRVKYNFEEKIVTDITKLKYKKGNIYEIKKIANQKVIPKYYKSVFINEAIGYMRRILILVKSNLFVDGKFINTKAFLKEFDYLKARRNEK